MLLSAHNWSSSLGSKDHPIPVDSDPEVPQQVSHLYPHSSTASPSQLPPPGAELSKATSRKNFRGKAKIHSSSMNITQSHSSVQSELLIAQPMTLHSQDLSDSQSLKRKRDAAADEEEAQSESAKRLKKAEKKRRNKERRATRVAQLGGRMLPNMPQTQGWAPSNEAGWNEVQPPHMQLDFDMLPGDSSYSCDPVQAVAAPYPQGFQLSFPQMPFGAGTEGMTNVQGPTFMMRDSFANSNHALHGFKSITPSPPYSELAPPETPGTVYAAVHPLSSSSSKIHPDSRGIPPFDMDVDESMSTNPPDRPMAGSSAINRRIQARMELLIEHRRLGTEADPTSQPGFSPLSPPPSLATAKDIVAVKQTLLDLAITENKAALTQLGGTISKEQKTTLMKFVIERNKFITQLTSEIRAHYESFELFTTHRKSPTPRFKWPETQFPIYVVLSSDSEESDSES